MEYKWTKCASVTTGGKPHFWFKNGAARQWIIWNRNLKHWEHRQELGNGDNMVVLKVANTDKALLSL